jgi:hypothetical protein
MRREEEIERNKKIESLQKALQNMKPLWNHYANEAILTHNNQYIQFNPKENANRRLENYFDCPAL